MNKIKKILHYINKLLLKIINIVPEKYRYIIIGSFWIILLINGYITENRLIRFCEILIIISIYKISHKNIEKIYKNISNYVEIKQEILWKIYKYKNPIIWLMIEIELKLFYFIYYLKKQNIKKKYINIIYNILYNLTGFNGIKIILNKIYTILNDWKNYNIDEIIFKRIYGMVFSILIFTNIIQLILTILNMITTNWIIWIYILLILISYIMNIPSIINIEYIRLKVNLIWTILEEEKNKMLNSFIIDLRFKKKLNYANYFKYLILANEENIEIEYRKPLYIYFKEVQEEIFNFDTEYIFAKNVKLKKQEKNKNDIDLLNLCEYNILIYKLILYYIWDIEKVLGIKNNLITIETQEIDWTSDQMYSYEYNKKELKKVYDEKITNIELDKFWDLIENKEFYEKMHNYLNDNKFKNTKEYERLLEIERMYYVYEREDHLIEDSILKNQKEKELLKQLKDVKEEWEQGNKESKNKEEKYYKIFKKIEIIKNKYNENCNNKY